jgi:hypothetical protein
MKTKIMVFCGESVLSETLLLPKMSKKSAYVIYSNGVTCAIGSIKQVFVDRFLVHNIKILDFA